MADHWSVEQERLGTPKRSPVHLHECAQECV